MMNCQNLKDMNRIYHHYEKLEETAHGMWRTVCGEEMRRLDSAAISFMNNIDDFSAAMLRVVAEWKYSCEHNLTSISSNRIAWIGQAAVCVATGAPESCARVGWYHLKKDLQNKANEAAQYAIDMWESVHLNRHSQMELFND